MAPLVDSCIITIIVIVNEWEKVIAFTGLHFKRFHTHREGLIRLKLDIWVSLGKNLSGGLFVWYLVDLLWQERLVNGLVHISGVRFLNRREVGFAWKRLHRLNFGTWNRCPSMFLSRSEKGLDIVLLDHGAPVGRHSDNTYSVVLIFYTHIHLKCAITTLRKRVLFCLSQFTIAADSRFPSISLQQTWGAEKKRRLVLVFGRIIRICSLSILCVKTINSNGGSSVIPVPYCPWWEAMHSERIDISNTHLTGYIQI